MTRIALHVEHLFVDGLPIDAAEVGLMLRGAERELARRFEEQRDLVASLGADRARSAVPELVFQPGATPATLGRELAGALFQGLSPSTPAGRGGGDR